MSDTEYPEMPTSEQEWRAHWAFYRLAIAQRDAAWREIEHLSDALVEAARQGDLPMTTKPYVSSASDYAGLTAGPWTFYYGYEWGYYRGQVTADRDDEPEVWGFTATRSGTVVLSLSADELSDRLGERLGQGDTTRILLLGIGLALQLAVHAP